MSKASSSPRERSIIAADFDVNVLTSSKYTYNALTYHLQMGSLFVLSICVKSDHSFHPQMLLAPLVRKLTLERPRPAPLLKLCSLIKASSIHISHDSTVQETADHHSRD